MSRLKRLTSSGLQFIFSRLQKYGFLHSINARSFRIWWKRFRESSALPTDLVVMVDFYINTPAFETASGYWNYLSKLHIELLHRHGIENYKQTIERFHYWGEADLDSRLLKPIIDDLIEVNVKTADIFRTYDFCERGESIQHNLATIVLLNFVIKNGHEKYLQILEEPDFGNPIYIHFKDRRISFSLLNSILEIDFIMQHMKIKNGMRLLEIGAGSGRTAFALMNLIPGSKYIIVDIPPGLFISQENMLNIFPEKKIFKFRQFLSYAEVEDEISNSDIVFLSPEQTKFIPDKFADLSIAIDCLHEMTTSDVEKYFDLFDKTSRALFFKCQTTQWAKTSDVIYTVDNYPIRPNWKKIVHEKCYIPNDYFHAIYEFGPSGA